MFEKAGLATSGVADHLASLVACASDVAVEARSAAGWSAPARVAALASLDAVVAAVAEARAHVLVADRDAGDSQLPGDRSFEAARARVTRAGVGEARRQVQQADALVSMGTVAVGVRDGSVPLGHLDVLARVAASASPEVAAVLRSVEVQEDVVRLARIQSAPDFGKALARFVAAQDPAGLEAAHRDAYRERFLSVSAQPHGVFVKGRLDVTAGQTLLVALDAMGQFPDESRTPGQACADALVMLAERVCAGTTAPVATGVASAPAEGEELPDGAEQTVTSGTGSRPHLSLLVPAATFAELLAHERARQAAPADRDTTSCHGGANSTTGSGAGSRTAGGAGKAGRRHQDRERARVAPGWSPVAPATLEDGTPVAMSELARCLCEADITRIVMAADGQPLDVGRTRRLHTPAQRKAVIARDGQCVWNGCETPAARCEVHHVLWWNRDNGPTDVEHAALACRHHHGEIHRHDLSIQRLPHPPGTDPATPTRYVFRTPDRAVINAPPGWTETETVESSLASTPAARPGRGTPATAAWPGPPAPAARHGSGPISGPGSRERAAASVGVMAKEARRVAREQASFALFESDGPPPEWAAG